MFQKLVVWTLLWEVIGLGAGSMPLTFRFSPMIGGILYWLRPGTVRQPPWPERVPLTAGTTRTLVDVLLYAGLLAGGVYLLVAGEGGTPVRLEPAAVGVTLALLGLLGLRDKLPFLAARTEVYGTLLVVCLFPLEQPDRGGAAHVRRHLVGRRVVEAQPPLPVRGVGDDQQHAVEPVQVRQAAAVHEPPRGSAALAARAR